MCVYLNTFIHTYVHTHIHKYTITHMHTYSHTHIHSQTNRHAYTHAYTYTRTHAQTHAFNTCIHSCVCSQLGPFTLWCLTQSKRSAFNGTSLMCVPSSASVQVPGVAGDYSPSGLQHKEVGTPPEVGHTSLLITTPSLTRKRSTSPAQEKANTLRTGFHWECPSTHPQKS